MKTETQIPTALHTTPWGNADYAEPIGADGIWSVSTPSHGGYFVPSALLNRIPFAEQSYAEYWSGSRNWFEEDCCAVSVILAFPDLFPQAAHQLDAMRAMMKESVRKHLCERKG